MKDLYDLKRNQRINPGDPNAHVYLHRIGTIVRYLKPIEPLEMRGGDSPSSKLDMNCYSCTEYVFMCI